MTQSKQTREPIAVVGVSALFPGSIDEQGFWKDILAGRDLIRDVPETHWLIEDYYDPDPSIPDKTYCKRGGFLDKLDFDPVAFGIPPRARSALETLNEPADTTPHGSRQNPACLQRRVAGAPSSAQRGGPLAEPSGEAQPAAGRARRSDSPRAVTSSRS